MNLEKYLALIFYIPAEITSWFIGKKIIQGIINEDKQQIDKFDEIFKNLEWFADYIYRCIYLGNLLYYGKGSNKE